MGPGQRVRDNDCHAERQGRQQAHDKRIDVVQWQGKQQAIVRTRDVQRQQCGDVAGEITVRQRNSLRRPRSAGCIEQHCAIVR